jgi:hypothetical protein
MVGVLLHQLEGPTQHRLVEEPDRGFPARDEVTEIVRSM